MFFPHIKKRRVARSLLSGSLFARNACKEGFSRDGNRRWKKHLSPLHDLKKNWNGKARSGSVSVETLLVLPLFLFGMITLISFMELYRVQTVHLARLCEEAKQEGLLRAADGSGDPTLTLTDSYSISLPGLLLPLPAPRFENRVQVHCWTGKAGDEGFSAFSGDESEPVHMVYITETGHVIHSSTDCSYLRLSTRQIPGSSVSDARNIYGQRYRPCSHCSRGQPPGGLVYVTEEGTSYHNSGSCSGLKRSVLMVPESEVEGWKHCSRCGSQG